MSEFRSYSSESARKILNGKYILIIGDSIYRCVYKDLILLLQRNTFISDKVLREKGEKTCYNDELVEGGVFNGMTNARNCVEVRSYKTDTHMIQYHYITRCYYDYVESVISEKISLENKHVPDVVIMNSCLWDLTRYGIDSIETYQINMEVLFYRLKNILHKNTLLIWMSSLPLSMEVSGPILVPSVSINGKLPLLRLDVIESNAFIATLAKKYGFEIIDLHYHFRGQVHRRARDGIHWDATAHRRITNMILQRIEQHCQGVNQT